jgi:two-component system NarL family sensor kinase
MPDSPFFAKIGAQRKLRIRIILIASIPLLLAIAAVVWMVGDEAKVMEGTLIEAIKSMNLKARKDELQHFVQVGSKVLSHFFFAPKR